MIGGRYAIKNLIGRGGMGEVLLAEDTVLDRLVAIKHIARSGNGEDASTAEKRLLREAKSAARIHHHNVVAVYDFLVEGTDTYIVMEYVPAPNLEQVLRTGSLPLTDIARIGSEVAAALEAAHQLGIVHRDVKPSNVLVDKARGAKLVDFGVARSATDAGLTQTGLVIGSVAFMPPEVAKGFEATPAADIYSLGATLFAAVEGHAPFAENQEQSTPIAVLARLVTSPPPVPTQAGALTDLIVQMLASDPQSRPTAREVQDELDRLGAARPGALAEVVADSGDRPVPTPSDVESPIAMTPVEEATSADHLDSETRLRPRPADSGTTHEDDDEPVAATIIKPKAQTSDGLLPQTNVPPSLPPSTTANTLARTSQETRTPEQQSVDPPRKEADPTLRLTPIQKQRKRRRRVALILSIAVPAVALVLVLGLTNTHRVAAGFKGTYTYKTVLEETTDPTNYPMGAKNSTTWQVATSCWGPICHSEATIDGVPTPVTVTDRGFTSEQTSEVACGSSGNVAISVERHLEFMDVQDGQVKYLLGTSHVTQRDPCNEQDLSLLDLTYRIDMDWVVNS